MIDLHCHIMPWVDDGAKDATTALRMLEHAWRTGVKTIVATPHSNLKGALENYSGVDFNKRFALFQALVRQSGIPIKILPGAEIFAHESNLNSLLRENRLVTINHSRYLLVEFKFHASAKSIEYCLDTISSNGYTPVIAHPERYVAVQTAPALAARWFSKGYIIQLNKGSLLERLGVAAYQAALHILSIGVAHVIASDAHDMQRRPTGFKSLLPVLERTCPPDYIQLLLTDNPQKIIDDVPIIPQRMIEVND